MGGYQSAPNTVKSTHVGGSDKLRYAVTGMQGWRETMEDAHICEVALDAETSLFAVLDGHGGKEVSTFVSRHFCEELLRNPNYAAGKLETALSETFLYMDIMMTRLQGIQELYKIQQDIPDNYSVQISSIEEMEDLAGTTACVALMRNNTLYVANAGDSRCVLARAGRAIDMSVDHKAELLSEQARVRKAGGYIEDGRVNGQLAITRSIGDFEFKTNPRLPLEGQIITSMPDVKVEQLQPEDQFLILGCDGIWDVLTSQECVDYVLEKLDDEEPLEDLGEHLCDYCLAEKKDSYGSNDNMTFTLVLFKH